jgi:ATP-dependent Zn protease
LEHLLDIVSDGASATPEMRRHAAIHEAGHGVAAIRLGRDDVRGLGLRSGGGGEIELGQCVTTGARATEVDDMIVLLLCGRAAEEVALGSGTAGAFRDLSEATQLALLAETRFGFGKLGSMSLLSSDPDRLLALPEVRAAVFRRLEGCGKRAAELIEGNRAQVLAVADALERDGYISGDELKAIIAKVDGAASVDVEPST